MATRASVEAGSRTGPDVAAARPYSLLRRRGPWKDALRRRLLALADLLAAAFGLVAGLAVAGANPETVAVSVALLPLWLLLARGHGLYHRDHVRIGHGTADELSALFYWVTLSVGLSILALDLTTEIELSATVALVMWGVAMGSTLLLRPVARAAWRSLVPRERTFLIGGGPLAEAVRRKLTLQSAHHLSLVREIPLSGSNHADEGPLRLPEGPEAPERVIVAMDDLNEENLSFLVSMCRERGIKLSVVPPLRAMLGTAVDLHHLAELPFIEFRTWDAPRSTMLLKRLFDLTGAAVAVIVCAPVMVLIAIAVRLDSPGPILFRQRRAGLNGKPFTMLKFRTMADGAEGRVGEVVSVEELSDPAFKVREDPRVTRVGRVLRRMSLDELPQVVNVLRGEMSLVGPRPEELWLVDRYVEADRFRLAMRPGMTGPMQVYGRGDLSFQERLAVEREYVENYSLAKDVQILLRTVRAVVRGHGAY